MCDIAYTVLSEQVERVALADRQAELTVAISRGAEDYRPINVAARVAEFEALLASDPNQSTDARVARRMRELLEA